MQIASRGCIPGLRRIGLVCIDWSSNELVLVRRATSSGSDSLLVPLLGVSIAIVEVVEGGSLTHLVLEDKEVGLGAIQVSIAARLWLLVSTTCQDKVRQSVQYNTTHLIRTS